LGHNIDSRSITYEQRVKNWALVEASQILGKQLTIQKSEASIVSKAKAEHAFLCTKKYIKKACSKCGLWINEMNGEHKWGFFIVKLTVIIDEMKN